MTAVGRVLDQPDGPPVALVTGATGGIGTAVCRALGAQGYAVVVHDFAKAEAGKALATDLPAATYVDGDISDPEVAPRLVAAAVDRWGRLDVVVNNAGIARQIPHRDLDAVPDEFWHQVLGVNLLGPWQVSRAAAPSLRATRGTIINVASLAGLTVSGSSIPYAVSKAGLIHLTKLLAVALAPEIRVNAIAPGYIDTPLTHDWTALRDTVSERAPLGRLGTPEDAAAAVQCLLNSPYTTGAVLTVDGGLHLS
ncbi:SDR family NAD(P)-dependent oxidoreductase [Streptomyces chartreusis]|uniref:SDR family oxidoreductase n=1 Tax=Streptomyces chartreusis TaxID=1969 RepID=A0A7H8T1C6_STRCX|nr:SDR family oxidoreductase [Streptomyces chartreusis]QKZ17296.1 SDR family oxidoreductase [Streptomyces chartreusis]